jgi:uncharacterized protein (DUF1697 family)
VDSRILLLRAINVASRRVAMPALREMLAEAGLVGARTHLQSGNVVVRSDADPDRLAADCRRLLSSRLGFDVPVIVRTGAELEAVLAADPLATVATEPKRYWVSFCDRAPAAETVERLAALARGGEQVLARRRELFAWLPDGGGRSKLGVAMAAPEPGLIATARNWATVARLTAMAGDS